MSESTAAILKIVRACPVVQLATIRDDGYPETRDMANMLNTNATDLNLMFLTGRNTPKIAQIKRDNKCALYYYDDATHYSVRLFGTLEMIDNRDVCRKYWSDEFTRFGYSGADDPEFVLIRFTPHEYKYYDADGLQTGKLK